MDPRAAADAVKTPLSEVFPLGAELSSGEAGELLPQEGDWGVAAARDISDAALW
jgi:hypothetical protein